VAYQLVGVEDVVVVMRLRRNRRKRMRCGDILHKPWNPLEAIAEVTTLCIWKGVGPREDKQIARRRQ